MDKVKLRRYYAGCALQGYVSSEGLPYDDEDDRKDLAEQCFKMAEAMIDYELKHLD